MTEADPAALATRRPEDPSPTAPVHAVGVGPGDPSFLTERASGLLERADVVTGFETALTLVRDRTTADLLACRYDDQSAVLETTAERVAEGARGVVAFWGDPNVSGYQFLGRVEAAVDRPVRVVPGVSSVQVAAALARTPLDRATVVSLHRRGDLEAAFDRLANAGRRGPLIVLVRPYDWMPPAIARTLLDRGLAPDRSAVVAEELTLPAERIEHTTLATLAGSDRPARDYADRSILVVRDD